MEEEKEKKELKEITSQDFEAFEKNNKLLQGIIEEKIKIQKYLADNIEIDEELTSISANEKKVERLEKLKEQKLSLIKEAIGQMYKGVLIEGKMSVRNGECYFYRGQYAIDISSIKSYIMENLHEVRGKLSDENIDILEFLLDKVEDNAERDITLCSLPVDDYILIEREDDSKIPNLHGTERIKIVDNIQITKSRYSINISYSFRGDGVYIEEKERKILLFKFRDKLKEIVAELNKTINSLIKTREQEIEDIKGRAKNLLIVSALQKSGEGEEK